MANDKTHRYQTQVLWTFFQSQNRAVAYDAQTAKLAPINDNLIAVKGNQPRLLAQLKTLASHHKPCERFVDIEKSRGRTTCRIIIILTDLCGVDLDWVGLRSLIQIERN